MFFNEITELLQLDLPQSEVCNSGYKINKATVSAVFTDSGSFIVLYITPRIQILKFWIFYSKSSMNFVNLTNWIYFNRSFVARDKTRIALLCRITERTDLVYRIKIDRGLQRKDWLRRKLNPTKHFTTKTNVIVVITPQHIALNQRSKPNIIINQAFKHTSRLSTCLAKRRTMLTITKTLD